MFKNITLEMSLKPFKQTDSNYIHKTVRQMFEQWRPLLKNRKIISVMLWTSDGSEILDYSGNCSDEFEWCKFIGTANNPTASPDEPLSLCLHHKNRLYIENPPKMTYKILKEIISAIKSEGKQLFPGSVIRVGETFDIGPEFAASDFKYNRHKEICTGGGMGDKTFINSYGELSADNYCYAGFPDGIPDKTPFGTFLGRQAQIFLKDMDFDFLWLSNGVGFSANSWSSNGEIFDGQNFHTENFNSVRKKVFDFWKFFRKECPGYPIETRGTNYSAGIDYASDAVPLYDIYNSGLNIMPPPNSPWAALDGNFGLELMGHMTRICELPGEDFMFRYYIHDPWWLNSPWYDRYEGQPHDIYMPMALSMINKSGKTLSASVLNILSIDNSFGNMPDSCVNEPLPHLLKSEKDAPDEPAPFTWIYPLREYTTTHEEYKLQKMMSEDWFICEAINNGFPLSSVVSCDNFIIHNKDIYKKSILISPVPDAGSAFEKTVLDYIKNNGKIIFYGALNHAGKEFLNLFGIGFDAGVSGEIKIDRKYLPDIYSDNKYPEKINVREFISDGKINTISTSKTPLMELNDKHILAARYKNSIWFRAPVGGENNPSGGHIITDNASESAKGEILLRKALEELGYSIRFKKANGDLKTPVIMLHRSNNSVIFSIYSANTTVETLLKFPLGAPILIGYETELQNEFASYRFPRAEHRECRVFVEQQSGIVGAKEIYPTNYKYRRRIMVTGLKNATVRFFGEEYCKKNITAVLNSEYPWQDTDKFDCEIIESPEFGTYFEARNVTGELVFSMPFPGKE